MAHTINRTMDRSDLLTDAGQERTRQLNDLIQQLYSRGLYMTSRHGTLPRKGLELSVAGLKHIAKRVLGRAERIGFVNRGAEYQPLPSAADDGRIPWYLYWETHWVLLHGPRLEPGMRVLDAGGTSSLFTCFLASLGCEVHSVDLNPDLVANGDRIAEAMGWPMFSYAMNMRELAFPDEHFHHAYSICVFEHLDDETKRVALCEIARCLKPGGCLCITFDYRNPHPGVVGCKELREEHLIGTPHDVERVFLSSGLFDLVGNQVFQDNGLSYLVHPDYENTPYTFGAAFLQKRG